MIQKPYKKPARPAPKGPQRRPNATRAGPSAVEDKRSKREASSEANAANLHVSAPRALDAKGKLEGGAESKSQDRKADDTQRQSQRAPFYGERGCPPTVNRAVWTGRDPRWASAVTSGQSPDLTVRRARRCDLHRLDIKWAENFRQLKPTDEESAVEAPLQGQGYRGKDGSKD